LPKGKELPDEERMLALASGHGFSAVKGAIEAVLDALHCKGELEAVSTRLPLLDPERTCRLTLGGKLLGWLGELSAEGLKQFDLRQSTTIAELKIAELLAAADLVPQYQTLPAYPAISRDLNLVVDESVRWADLAATVRTNCEDYLEELQYRDTYRDPDRLGADKKSLLMTVVLRWKDGTMTSTEADRIRDRVVAACGKRHAAELRA
jgi:phenylalanyl-tRNA synthetase beta chain